MPHDVREWPPGTVYPGEVLSECPEAQVEIDLFLLRLCQHGPSPEGFNVKPLGAKLGGLWQCNMKVAGRQVRILYAPYGGTIVLFRIHKKSSKQEQNRAYAKAVDRKRKYELLRKTGDNDERPITVH